MGGFGGIINSEHKQESQDNRAGASDNAILAQDAAFVFNGSGYQRFPATAVLNPANPWPVLALAVIVLVAAWFFFLKR